MYVTLLQACLRQEASNIRDTAADTSKRGADAVKRATETVKNQAVSAAEKVTKIFTYEHLILGSRFLYDLNFF